MHHNGITVFVFIFRVLTLVQDQKKSLEKFAQMAQRIEEKIDLLNKSQLDDELTVIEVDNTEGSGNSSYKNPKEEEIDSLEE